MTLGLGTRFNILNQSPLDLEPQRGGKKNADPETVHWVPSRYNIRATAEDGRLVLWNSYRGTMSVFEVAQKLAIETLLSQKGFDAPAEGVVKYLRDRGFLVAEGVDEYRRIQLGFGRQHYRTDRLELILLASEDCNFRCEYCYEDFARGTMKPWVREGIKNLVEKRLSSLRSLSISWFGGEPLYGWPAIEELAPFFIKTADENGLQYSSKMTTNGFLLTPEVADQLLAWRNNAFQITIDGPPEYHDRSRPTREGEGTFATIFNNLKEMSRRRDDFLIDVRVNFDQRNHPEVPRFLDLLESELGGDSRFRLLFRAVGRWGGPNDEQLEVCGVNDARSVQADMRTEARKRGLRLTDDIRHVQGLGAQVCYAARPYNFIIGADGDLMKCTIDLAMKDRNLVGRLTESGDLITDDDKLSLWTEPAFEKDDKCKKCVVLPVCQGIFCPQVRMDYKRSPCTPLRMNSKKELLGLVEKPGPSRTISVGGAPPAVERS